MLDIVELSPCKHDFCERKGAPFPSFHRIIIDVAQRTTGNYMPFRTCRLTICGKIAALGALLLPRTSGFARQWPRGRLPKAIEDIKNWLISSMYATAQKRRHINGILEKLSIAKKFSREYMLL
jgi:hypothetical protein